MVLVDTGVWISLFRKKTDPLGEVMYELAANNKAAICGQVYVEFIGGFRKIALRKEYAASFSVFPMISTGHSDFILAAELLAQYPHLGVGDAIIAATAINQQLPLLTLDKDFMPLSRHGLAIYPLQV